MGDVTTATDAVTLYDESGNAVGTVSLPLVGGGRVATSNPSAVGDGSAAPTMLDKLGKVVTRPLAPRGLQAANAVTLTTTTETTLIAAGGAGVFHDLAQVIVANEGNKDARIDFRDTTGGAIRFSVFVPKGMVGIQIPFAYPVEQAAANTNWTAQSSASSSVRVFASAVKNT